MKSIYFLQKGLETNNKQNLIMAYRRNAVVLSRVSTASQELESQTTALLAAANAD